MIPAKSPISWWQAIRSTVGLVSAAALLAFCGPALATPKFVDVYRLRVVAGHASGTHLSLVFRKVDARAGAFWMAEQRLRTTAGITGPTTRIERSWIDGRKCSALASVIGSIPSLSGPTVAQISPALHGARAHLATREPNGAYRVQSDDEGAVVRWWRDASQALRPCWGVSVTAVDDDLLPLTLENDSDEAPILALDSNP